MDPSVALHSEAVTTSGQRPSPVVTIAELTHRMCTGDESAYRSFHDIYVGRLERYLITLTSGDETAMRDSLQAMMQRVVRHIRRFDDEEVFWSWLTVLARSAWADERRKRARYGVFLDRFTAHVEVTSVNGGSVIADERLRAILASQVDQLPHDERQLIAWKYDGERSTRDIAAALATTEKAVESRLARLRLKLKQMVLTALKHDSAT